MVTCRTVRNGGAGASCPISDARVTPAIVFL